MKKQKIAIVEDNQLDVILIQEAIEYLNLDCELIHAETGSEGKRVIQENINDLAFIILDINLPGLSGLDLLEFLRKEYKNSHIPVLIFSNSGYSEDIAFAYKNGANAFLVKPSNFDEYKDIVQASIKFWTNQNLRVTSDVA